MEKEADRDKVNDAIENLLEDGEVEITSAPEHPARAVRVSEVVDELKHVKDVKKDSNLLRIIDVAIILLTVLLIYAIWRGL